MPDSGTRICSAFFKYLRDGILRSEQRYGFAGNRARRVKRAAVSCSRHLVKAYNPALATGIVPCFEALRALSSQVVAEQRISADLARRTRERATEQLYVVRLIAPGSRYDSLKKRLAVRNNCQERAIDERVRRFRRDHKREYLAEVVVRHLDNFKLAQFRKAHPGKLPALSTIGLRITALTEGEIDLISKLVREGSALRTMACKP